MENLPNNSENSPYSKENIQSKMKAVTSNITKDPTETFNKLVDLQLLIKKESGLRDLCK